MTKKIPITVKGFEQLEAEVKELKTVIRPKVIEDLAEARSHGDLKENAEYHAAREKQSFTEGRIQELESAIANAEIIDHTKMTGSRVVFGATVNLVDEATEEEKTFQIVGEYEANIDKGKISVTSPIARALIGKEEGDSVEVTTPGGKKSYEILSVKFI